MWDLGRTIRSDKNAVAAVEIKVSSVLKTGLGCSPDPETIPVNFPEHGVIVGWSDDKSKQMALAQELAANYVTTHMAPPS